MEGLMQLGAGLGIAIVIGFILWLVFKYKNKSELVLGAVSLSANLSKTIIDLFIKDEAKKKKYKDFIDLLLVGVMEVEKSKTAIQAKMKAEGWDEANITQLHDAYTQEAIRIAKKYADEFGITYDGFSEGMMITVVKLFLGFFRQSEPQVVEIDLTKYLSDEKGFENKDGPFPAGAAE